MACGDYARISPENPDCAWCGRYRINLDREGRFCARCANEIGFRAMLERQAAVRFGGGCAGGESFCNVFRVATDEEQCARCKSEPEFRGFLHGQWLARRRDERAERMRDCTFRGGTLRTERRGCCGGERREVRIFRCEKRGEAGEWVCAECAEWRRRE